MGKGCPASGGAGAVDEPVEEAMVGNTDNELREDNNDDGRWPDDPWSI